MNDHQQPGQPQNGQPNQWSPPAGPPTGSTDFAVFDTAQAPAALAQGTVQRGPKNLGRMGLAAALVVTAGVGGYAVNSALSEPAGPQSPGEAFESFFVAVDNEDLAGVLELMPPGERESLVEPTAAVMRQLQRLDVLDADADTSSLGGFDLTVEGVTYSVEQLDPRLAWITTTGGTVTTADLDLDQLPFGSLIDDAIESSDATMALDSEVEAADGETTDLGRDPFSLAVVEDDGSWYVSLMYTAAESARNDANEAFPGLGNGPTPIGGATPGDAIKGMVEASVDLDLAGVIAHLDPVEMAALYDYAPLFLDEAEAGVQSFQSEVGTITVDRIDTRSWERNGRTMVGIDGFAGSFAGTDPFSGEPTSGSVDFDGDCYALEFNGETQRVCTSDLDAANADATTGAGEMAQAYSDIIDELGIDLSAFEDLTFPEQGITVVERDGRWYISVVPTMMYPIAETLEQFEANTFTDLVDSIKAIAEEGGDALFGMGGDDWDTLPQEPFLGEDEDFEVPFEEDAPFEDDDDFFSTATNNYVVEQMIPAGTPASELLAGGYISAFEVADEDLDFDTVWYLESELGGLAANRDLQVGEILKVDDFG